MHPYSPGNPYQDLLGSHLEQRNCTVQMSTGLLFLPKLLALPKPRVVHLHWLELYYVPRGRKPASFRLFIFALQLYYLIASRTPIIWTVHNLASHEGKNPRLERFAYTLVYRAAKKVIVHCQYAREQLRTRLPAAADDPDKIAVVSHGNYVGAYQNTVSRAEARRRLGLAADDFVFLSLGAVRAYKGGVELIEAFRSIMPSIPVKLVIAGRAHQEDARRQLETAARDLQDRIMFRPEFVAGEDLQTYLNAADVFVAPFRDVLTSGSVILALSFGKPVIAPRLGCLPETLQEVPEFLYDPDEEQGLRRAMQAAIDRRMELSQLGAKGREIADRLPWGPIAQRMIDCYLSG